eukprot:GGOE01062286.1.p1 GENE.GGOE01062286.1~~GGOE01062286.1.p1  ORF type:complete len:979 (+),score=274.70 GGOE01062286.1:79-2937(+)
MDKMGQEETSPLLGNTSPVTFRRHAWTLLELRTAISKRIEQRGHSVDLANAILSVLFLILHIFQTYQPPPPCESICWALEVCMAAFFLLRLVSLIILAFESSSVYHTLRGSFLIDIVTILPVIPFSFMTVDGHSLHHSSYYRQLSAVNMAYPFRVIRAYYTLDRYLSGMDRFSVWNRQLYHTCLVMSTIMIFTGSFIHQTPWIPIVGWHNAMFYTAVMGGTMGFLDPNNDTGRIIVMAFIVTLMISVPMQIGAIMQAQAKRSSHSGSYLGNSNLPSPHVIVCGYISWPAINTVIREILHHLHGPQAHRDVVLIDPEEPSEGLEDMLSDPSFSRVLFIKGSPLEASTLWKARLQEAAALIILCDKLGDPEEEDAKVVMITALATCHSTTPVHAQVHLPENYDRVIRAGARLAICLQSMKLGRAAKTCVCPGLPTVMSNLFRSFAEKDLPRFEFRPPWMVEYCKGMEHQVYCVGISDAFVGKEFMSVVVNAFQSLNVVIIGVVVDFPPKVQLNPGPNYVFTGTEMVVAIATKLSRARKLQDMDFGQSPDVDIDGGLGKLKRQGSERHDIPLERHRSESFSMPRPKWLTNAATYGAFDAGTSVASDLDSKFFSPYGEEKGSPVSPWRLRQDCTTFSNVIMRMREDGNADSRYWEALSPYFEVVLPAERPALSQVLLTEYVPTDHPHIVVTGDVFPLFPFLLPLRCKHGERHHPILFLYSHFPESEWATISLFPHVYVMIGSITKAKDLRRASVSTAYRVLMLSAHRPTSGQQYNPHNELLEDANAVMGLLAIEEVQDWSSFQAYASAATLTVVELRHRRSLMLLKPQMLLDSVTVPAHFNFAPRFAAGLALTNDFADAFMAGTVYNPHLPDIINQLFNNAPAGAFLAQVRCPPGQAQRPYSALFLHFARRHALALGLYRVGHGGSLLPYVFTNPHPDTIVSADDYVFVLKRGRGF